MSIIHYAIEIYSTSTDEWTATSDASVGLYSGVFRFVTDRPQYDGATATPMYSDDEISIDGVDISGTYNTKIYKEGMIQKDGITGNPSREIDIVTCGQYSTVLSFSFKIRNDNLFWNFCKTNNINFTGRRVIYSVIIDDVFYQCARGRITNNPYNETDYEFNVSDDSKLIHKSIPPVSTIDDKGESTPIPVIFGNVPYTKVLKVSSDQQSLLILNKILIDSDYYSFKYAAATEYILNDFRYGSWEILLNTTTYFNTNELSGKYVGIVSGGDSNHTASTDYIYKIYANSSSAPATPPMGGYITAIQLLSSLLSDSVTEFPAFSGSSVYGVHNSGSAVVSTVNTVWFYIADYEIKTVLSNYNVINIVCDNNKVPLVWTFDKTLNAYQFTNNVVITSNGTELYLKSNTSTSDGKVIAYSALNLKLYEVQFARNIIDIGTISGNDIVNIADKDRSTGYSFYPAINKVLNVDNVGAFSFKFILDQNITIPDKVYICADMTLSGLINGQTIKFGHTNWVVLDLNGNILLTGNNGLIDGDIFAYNQPTSNGHYNFTPNEVIKNYAGNEITLLEKGAVLSTGKIFKAVFAIDKSAFSIKQAHRINIAIQFVISGSPASTITLVLNEVCLVGESSIETITGDIYARISGEKTGPLATSANHSTDDVYHAFIHILEDYDKIPKNLIDYGDLASSRIAWKVSRTLTDKKNSIDYLNELCSHSFVAMFGTRTGKRGLRSINSFDNLGTPKYIHDENIVIRDSIESFEKTDISQLFNNFNLQYNYDPGSDKYIKSFSVSLIDFYPYFPSVDSVGGYIAITPYSYSTLSNLIAANNFIYGNIFYTKDGSDTTNAALAAIKGGALVANDPFIVTGSNSAIIAPAIPNQNPTWYSCFSGFPINISSPSTNYADAKSIWDSCKASYTYNQSVMQAQADISELSWFGDSTIFDAADLSSTGISSSAFMLLSLLAKWATLQKYIVSYRVPINSATINTELLDTVSFTDKIYTNSSGIPGIIIHIEPDASTDQLIINTMLEPFEIRSQDLIIERGPLLNTDTIQEGNNQTDTIVELGV